MVDERLETIRPETAYESFVSALQELDELLDDNLERTYYMKRRIRYIRDSFMNGKQLKDIVTCVERPLVIDLLRACHEGLGDYNARIKHLEIMTLYEEGMTSEEITKMLGLSPNIVRRTLRRPSLAFWGTMQPLDEPKPLGETSSST